MDDKGCFITCGTALPDPEDGQSSQKLRNKELQVRDEKGRQRFHGAFTGGFSAGYFNTVGTKEGWTPSSFVSSRSKTAEHIQQNPEDFMDEEDFSEFGIAPRKIHTTAKFRDVEGASVKPKASTYSDTVIPGEPPLKELVKPVIESIGIQILIKLGWKPGQGIGPRVRKRRSKRWGTVEELISDTVNFNPEADDPMLEAFTFAPNDAASLPYTPKDDYHGIGYTGLSTQSVLTAPSASTTSDVTKSWLQKSKKKLLISGKAFGIGALEDDDDVDVYSREDMSQYDFSQFSSEEKNRERNTKGGHESHTIHRGVLEGFIKSENALTVRKEYPMPQLPPRWVPVRKSLNASFELEPTHSKSKVLTSEERSVLLGEKRFHTLDPPASSCVVPVVQDEDKQTVHDRAAVSDFKPFINDPAKQKRYETYLKHPQKEYMKALQPACTTEWEKQQELEEFARAASLYQPLSKTLSFRFVSTSHLEAECQRGLVKVEKSSEKSEPVLSGPSHMIGEWHPASLLCKRFNVPNPYPNSSFTGVPNSEKGRSSSLFDCLAFQDKPEHIAHPDTSLETLQETKLMKPLNKMEYSKKSVNGSEDRDDSANESLMPVPEEIAPGVIKPPMDLFKAIFDTSDEEEESGNESMHLDHGQKEKEITVTTDPPSVSEHSDLPSVSERSDPPSVSEHSDPPSQSCSTQNSTVPKKAFGVFANLDLDRLVVKKPTTSVPSPPNTQQLPSTSICHSEDCTVAANEGQVKEKPSQPSEAFYGPKLPPAGYVPPPIESKSHSHKHAKRKAKHKSHKHKKKKSKKQKKRRSGRDDSQSNSSISSGPSDSEEDIDPLSIIKKLNDLHNKTGKRWHSKH